MADNKTSNLEKLEGEVIKSAGIKLVRFELLNGSAAEVHIKPLPMHDFLDGIERVASIVNGVAEFREKLTGDLTKQVRSVSDHAGVDEETLDSGNPQPKEFLDIETLHAFLERSQETVKWVIETCTDLPWEQANQDYVSTMELATVALQHNLGPRLQSFFDQRLKPLMESIKTRVTESSISKASSLNKDTPLLKSGVGHSDNS